MFFFLIPTASSQGDCCEYWSCKEITQKWREEEGVTRTGRNGLSHGFSVGFTVRPRWRAEKSLKTDVQGRTANSPDPRKLTNLGIQFWPRHWLQTHFIQFVIYKFTNLPNWWIDLSLVSPDFRMQTLAALPGSQITSIFLHVSLHFETDWWPNVKGWRARFGHGPAIWEPQEQGLT